MCFDMFVWCDVGDLHSFVRCLYDLYNYYYCVIIYYYHFSGSDMHTSSCRTK